MYNFYKKSRRDLKLLILFGLLFSSINTFSQSFPPGFRQVIVSGGFISPTTMDQAPDGRWFVCQQNGVLKVIKNNQTLSRPFITLNVNTNGERGLLGVAFDPDFPTNQYVYLCYTVSDGSYNLVSRFTASGDTVVPGSEVVLLQLDSLIANYHGGGHLEFGPDGTLYVSAGENGRPAQSQNLTNYLGKIIRINKDGSVPADNPFADSTGKMQRIWAYGLRNPFTFTFQHGTNRMFINDVGEVTWEEINDGTIGGRNFGWPQAEGMSNNPNFVNPIYTYLHGTNPGQGCSITGGAFLTSDSTNYPSQYRNKYFYTDYCANTINYINPDTSVVTWNPFGVNIANYSVGITTGNDGNLYFLSRNNQAVYKVVYDTTTFPVIFTQPQDLTLPISYNATFSVNASGAQPLTYQWRKDTINIPGANGSTYTIPSVSLSDSGYYNVIITNSFGTATSTYARLNVLNDYPPTANILTPTAGSMYAGGDTIYFTGNATDPEDGAIDSASYKWIVEFHHDNHYHPGPSVPNGVASGYFVVPTVGEVSSNVFYRLLMVVEDSDGFSDTSYVDIMPKTSRVTITTEPKGLVVLVDGQPFRSPHTFIGVEGIERTIEAPNKQIDTTTSYVFRRWTTGGGRSQTISTPVNNKTYIAVYYSRVTSTEYGLLPQRLAGNGNDDGVVFPNPTKGSLSIESTTTISEVHLYNQLGEKILSKQVNEKAIELNIEDQKPGVYFIEIKDETTTKRKAVILEK